MAQTQYFCERCNGLYGTNVCPKHHTTLKPVQNLTQQTHNQRWSVSPIAPAYSSTASEEGKTQIKKEWLIAAAALLVAFIILVFISNFAADQAEDRKLYNFGAVACLILAVGACIAGLLPQGKKTPEEAKAERDVSQYEFEKGVLDARKENIPFIANTEREEHINKAVTFRKDTLNKLGITEAEVIKDQARLRTEMLGHHLQGENLLAHVTHQEKQVRG